MIPISIFSKGIIILSIYGLLLIIYDVFRLIFRKKYAMHFLTLTDTQWESFRKSETKITLLLKITLWLAGIALIIAPVTTFFFLYEVFPIFTIWMTIFFLVVLVHYIFHRWLIKYVQSNRNSMVGK
jgi:hypothetical protein